MGRHESSVDDQYHRYVVPQENGNRTDTRWFALRRKADRWLARLEQMRVARVTDR